MPFPSIPPFQLVNYIYCTSFFYTFSHFHLARTKRMPDHSSVYPRRLFLLHLIHSCPALSTTIIFGGGNVVRRTSQANNCPQDTKDKAESFSHDSS